MNINLSVSINNISDDILTKSDILITSDINTSYLSIENHAGWCRDITAFSREEQDRLVAFLIEAVMVPAVGAIGICGNVASVTVLSKSDFRETFHKLLICLSLVDSVFITCAVFTFLVRSLGLLDGPLVDILAPLFLLSLPMGSCALVTSMYLTISISVERYFGICYPLQSRVQGKRRLVVYLVPVMIFSIGFNIPKFLEITPGGELNWDLANSLLYNKIYKQYMELAVTVVIPLLALLFLNVRIYAAVCNKKIRGLNNSVRQKRESNLAIILIAIVLVFFCCHSLKFFLAFYKVHVTTKTLYCDALGLIPFYPKWMHTMSYLNHFMLVLNSSVNFIIYCFVGKKFRKSLICSLYAVLKYWKILNKNTKSPTTSETSRKTEMSFMSRTPSPRLHTTNNNNNLKLGEYKMISKMSDCHSVNKETDDHDQESGDLNQ